MAKQPVTTSSSWQLSQVGVPTDIVDPASVGTLMWSIQPIANCLQYLYDWITAGVIRIRVASSVANLRQVQAQQGDVMMLAGYGLYVFEAGAGHEETSVDADPLWFRSTSLVTPGRWQHVGAYITGTTSNRVPLVNADGRLDVPPTNAITGLHHLGEVQPEINGSGTLNGSLNCGTVYAGTQVLITARAWVYSNGDRTATYGLRVSENGGAPVQVASATYRQTAAASYGSVPLSFTHTVGTTGNVVISIAVTISGDGSAFSTFVQNIEALVVQP